MFYGCGAEEEDGVGLVGSQGGELRWVEFGRWQSFVGYGFGHLCAMLFQGGGQVWIGSIAAGEKDALAANRFAEFVGESYATVRFGAVRNREASLFCGAGRSWTYGCDLAWLPYFLKREPSGRKAIRDRVNCVFAGENEPVETGEVREAIVQGSKVVRRGKRDQRE
jgi:hypothetical protein